MCDVGGKKVPWEKTNFEIDDTFAKILDFEKGVFWNSTAKTIADKFPFAKKYFDAFVKTRNTDLHHKSDDDERRGWFALDLMITLFQLDHPKKYMEYFGWCSNHRFLLPNTEVKKMLLMKNEHIIAKYALAQISNTLKTH